MRQQAESKGAEPGWPQDSLGLNSADIALHTRLTHSDSCVRLQDRPDAQSWWLGDRGHKLELYSGRILRTASIS